MLADVVSHSAAGAQAGRLHRVQEAILGLLDRLVGRVDEVALEGDAGVGVLLAQPAKLLRHR